MNKAMLSFIIFAGFASAQTTPMCSPGLNILTTTFEANNTLVSNASCYVYDQTGKQVTFDFWNQVPVPAPTPENPNATMLVYRTFQVLSNTSGPIPAWSLSLGPQTEAGNGVVQLQWTPLGTSWNRFLFMFTSSSPFTNITMAPVTPGDGLYANLNVWARYSIPGVGDGYWISQTWTTTGKTTFTEIPDTADTNSDTFELYAYNAAGVLITVH